MLVVALVEDDKGWHRRLGSVLHPLGIAIEYFPSGDAFLEFSLNDQSDAYRAVLIDWNMPGLSGPELATRLRQSKPYLKLFAFTVEDDGDEIARIMHGNLFDGFLSKKSVDNKAKVCRFVGDIEKAIKDAEELIICRPFNDKPTHRFEYLALRARDWDEITERIGATSSRLCDQVPFSRKRTLRDSLPTKKSGNLLMENILTARRVILAEIFELSGKLHEVEVAVGYEEEADVFYDDPYKMYDAGFKTYCSELGLKPDVIRNSGDGILPEEAKWLRRYCEQIQAKYDFPIL